MKLLDQTGFPQPRLTHDHCQLPVTLPRSFPPTHENGEFFLATYERCEMALPSAAPATLARTIRNSVTGSGTPLKPLGDEKADDLALHARGDYDCCRFGPCHGIRRNTQALRSLNAKPFRPNFSLGTRLTG